jgi:hypothetical protein
MSVGGNAAISPPTILALHVQSAAAHADSAAT